MATFDFTPFYHATVGFDRISSLLADALERDETGFPHCYIEKTGDDAYRIVMALAGARGTIWRSSPRTTDW